MKILVTGAGGMIGRKLVERLAEGQGAGRQAHRPAMTLVDVVDSPFRTARRAHQIHCRRFQREGRGHHADLQERPDVIFHLAAIVSGDAEANFEKGYKINFNGSPGRCWKRSAWKAREVIPTSRASSFASTLAVYGPPFPDPIPDDFALTPSSSYGTQKAMTELLLADYSRKGYLDGVGVRLPTICIRPGKPNAAASSFFSGILREPLAGKEAPLPVGDDVRHWFVAPRRGGISSSPPPRSIPRELGVRRSMTMPGVSATVGEEIEALRKAAGEDAVKLIQRVDDPFICENRAGLGRPLHRRAGDQGGFQGREEFRRDHSGLSAGRNGEITRDALPLGGNGRQRRLNKCGITAKRERHEENDVCADGVVSAAGGQCCSFFYWEWGLARLWP